MAGIRQWASSLLSELEQYRRSPQIVAEGSAGLNGQVAEAILEADHSTICRFDLPGIEYTRVTSAMEKLLRALQARAPSSRARVEVASSAPSTQQPKVVHLIHFPPNENFVERKQQLDELREKLLGPQRCSKVALYGLGGVGKTQIALRFAHAVKDEEPTCSVLWVPAISAELFEQAYRQIARQYNLPVNVGKEVDIMEDVKSFLSSPASGRWLLVVDNVDAEDILFDPTGGRPRLYSFLPYSAQGSILFTTRNEAIATTITTNVIKVAEMDPDAGRELFKNYVGPGRAMKDADSTSQLLQNLMFLPLAIRQAAAYIKTTKILVSEYLQLLAESEASVVALLNHQFRELDRYSESQNPVAATWIVSFKRIRSEDPFAVDMLSFMSCLEPTNIYEFMLPEYRTRAERRGALGTLSAYSLLTQQDRMGEYVYHLHRLVQVVARAWLQSERLLGDWIGRAVERLDAVYPIPKYENRIVCGKVAPHVIKVLAAAKGERSRNWCQLCIKIGTSFRLEGRIKEQLSIFLEAEQWACEHLDENDRLRLSLQNSLAEAYLNSGQAKKAVTILEHTVTIEENLPDDHPARLASQHALAIAYYSNGQVSNAIAMLEHVVKVRKALPDDHPGRLASQHTLATAYYINGQIEKAVTILEHIVKMEENLPDDHPSRLASQHTLAKAYQASGQVGEAVRLLKHVVRVEEALTDGHPRRLISQRALLKAYLANEQMDEATKFFQNLPATIQATFNKEGHVPSSIANKEAS